MSVHVERSAKRTAPGAGGNVIARLSTETKNAFKTTEFWAMVALVVGILVASKVVGDDGNNGVAGNGGGDAFPAVRAWLYVAIVGSAYMVSRGLAKAGSREPDWADGDDLPGGRDN